MTQPGVAVEGLSLSIGAFRLNNIEFALSGGEILVILGPNGSGKSVTLETMAGFHRPDAGRVLIGGRDVTALPPEERNVGFMVQNFGLFPHLTVAQNVSIAKRTKRSSRAGRDTLLPRGDVAGLLGYFGISQLAQRTPQSLSPGEKQRVALARALAAEPDLFLFDEPFSALDVNTRDQLRNELLTFLRGLKIPAIFVTHDHSDAMTLADRVVVLRDGSMMQTGVTADIYDRPANVFVARFVGIENILAARFAGKFDGLAGVAIGDRKLRTATPAISWDSERTVYATIRAEAVSVHPPGRERPVACNINRFDARVSGLKVMGPLATVEIECGFQLRAFLLAHQAREMRLGRGSSVDVEIAAESIHLMAE
jgi:molybdate/tungstate transport system ATP-binding protein